MPTTPETTIQRTNQSGSGLYFPVPAGSRPQRRARPRHRAKPAGVDEQRPESERSELLDSAESLALLALKIDPKREIARLTLAIVHEARHDYENAVRILDELVAERESANTPLDHRKDFAFRQTRARNLVSQAKLISSGSPESRKLATAEACARRSLGELDLMTKVFAPLSNDASFQFNYIRIEAYLVLNSIARIKNQSEPGEVFHQKAANLIEKLAPQAAGKAFFEELRKRVEKAASKG